MTDIDNDGVRDEADRLPWLEAVEDEEEGVSTGKLAAFLIAAVLALGAVIGGVAWLRSQQPGMQGDGKLIAAAEGDYKVRPDAPGGMKVEGQGDTAFKASEGAAPKGKIDLNAISETPVAGTKAPKLNGPAAPMGKSATAPMPANAGKLVAAPPAAPVVRPAAVGRGGLVQLGAFSTEAKANQTWVSLAKRYAYLAPLAKSVETAQVGGGTVYRLRANAGGDAGTVCGKLRVAGESCMVVN
jgi:SPOR domain